MQSKYEQLVQYSKQYNIYVKMNSTVKIKLILSLE